MLSDWPGTASRAKSAVYDCFLIYLSRPRGYTEWWRMTRVPCGCGRTLRGTKVCRYNWHSAGPLSWPLPMLKYKYIFKWNIRKRFYQTALGNCYGLKSPKCWLQVKNNFIVLFIIIFLGYLLYLWRPPRSSRRRRHRESAVSGSDVTCEPTNEHASLWSMRCVVYTLQRRGDEPTAIVAAANDIVTVRLIDGHLPAQPGVAS